jgi:hypothetical protein
MSDTSELDLPDEATVAAYLANRLESTRAEAFEEYCLKHPDFAHRVEADLFLKEGMKQLQRPSRARPVGHRRRISLAIAAGLAVIVVSGLLLLPKATLGSLTAYRSVAAVPAPLLAGSRVSATLIRLRGDATVRRIVVPRGAGVLLVRVAPDSAPGRHGYAIGVVVEPRIIPRSVALDNLQADADGYVEMYLPLSTVAGKTLRLTVTASPATGEVPLIFRLQVAYPPTTPE